MMLRNEGPSTAAIARAKISSGIDRKTSTIRIRYSSTRPPTNPAMLPTVTPITTVSDTTMRDSRSEVRAPQMTPYSTSPPTLVVPSGCPGEPGGTAIASQSRGI